jgi:hypothetical protein
MRSGRGAEVPDSEKDCAKSRDGGLRLWATGVQWGGIGPQAGEEGSFRRTKILEC